MTYSIADLREHNPWWEQPAAINDEVKLKDVADAAYPWTPRLKHVIDLDGGIHTLRGPRQVGKTTLVKLIIKDLIDDTQGEAVFYYACDLLGDADDLTELLTTYLDWAKSRTDDHIYIFLDEIASVNDWQQAVKLLKDQGRLENTTVLLTGSHAVDIREGGELMPGRRDGGNDHVLTPMKFAEYLEVTEGVEPQKDALLRKQAFFDLFDGKTHDIIQERRPFVDELNASLDDYLITGGFPSSVNEYNDDGDIDHKLYELYIHVVLSDIYKQNKREDYTRDILNRVIETTTSRVSWSSLTKYTDINSHNTAETYVKLLRKSFLLNIIHKVSLNKHQPKRSSRKKIYVDDPFIFHAIRSWVRGFSNPYKKAERFIEDNEKKSKLVEAVVGSHLIRLAYNLNPSNTFNPDNHVFYWHNGKEIDFILKHDDTLYPIEVGYRNTIGDKGKWIRKRAGTPLILTKDQFDITEEYAMLPVSLFLQLV
jgi:predicted AAA+ superfamily ATPase